MIIDSYYSCLPKRYSRMPRERFVNYCRDMHALYAEKFSTGTLFKGSQYSHAELGDAVLSQCECLIDVDLLVAAIWTPEFDPDDASCSAYFANKYQIKGQIIDISDQGSLIPFTAFALLMKYFQANADKKILFMYLEQTTIPGSMHNKSISPVYDAAVAMVMRQHSHFERRQFEIIDCGICNENHDEFLSKVIADIVGFEQEQSLTVLTKYPERFQPGRSCQIKKLPRAPGPMPWLSVMHHIVCGRYPIQVALFLDQDVETEEIGYLILRSC